MLNLYLAFCATLLVILILGSRKRKRIKELPGVTTLFGIVRYWLTRLGKCNYEIMEDGAQIFGPVYQFRYGKSVIVPVHDLNLAKQIMSSPKWMNRLPSNHVIYERSNNKQIGLLFGNDMQWELTREFTVKTLAKLGFGKGVEMESYILAELDETLKLLDDVAISTLDSNGNRFGVFKPRGFFHVPTLNILWRLIAGSRFDFHDPELAELLRYFYRWNESFNLGATPLHLFPWLRHIPKLTEQDAWVDGHLRFRKFFKGIMEERLHTENYRLCQEDFIDSFLYEMDKSSNDPIRSQVFTQDQFLTTCTDLFMAGADTTSNSLEFAILFMAYHPEVQAKVQKEIDTVIGASTLSVIFRNRMPYTEATAMEIQRQACSIPVSGRCPREDSFINSCPVAKGTIMAINIHGLHFSRDIWEDPEKFRPERFLDSENKLVNLDKVMPFGYGKRKCPGEATSRATFFLFLTAMLQKYSFHLSPHHPKPSLANVHGLSRAPKPYHVMVKRRTRDGNSVLTS